MFRFLLLFNLSKMNKSEQKTSLHDYLEPVLETGNEEEIAFARKMYWKKYKAAWRKQRRKEQKEFAVSFTDKELGLITSEAKKHHRSRTGYIKHACLAYSEKRFLMADLAAFNRIRELLSLNYNSLQQLSEENVLQYHTGNQLMEKIAELERNVLTSLQNPKSLDQWIIESVRQNPESKMKLIELIKSNRNDH
jgi:ribosomal protein S25